MSGGYGADVSSTTDANGYYTLVVKPMNIGGPFALSFNVTGSSGNYNTIQGNITVTAPIVVPVDKVLSGTVIAGQTGTMVNKVGSGTVISPSSIDKAIPQGFFDGSLGSGKVLAVTFPSANVLSGTMIAGTAGSMPNKLGSGTVITPGTTDKAIPQGYFGGAVADGKVLGDPNLIATNIVSGKTIFGVTGTYYNPYNAYKASGTATIDSSGYITVTGLSFQPSIIIATYSAGSDTVIWPKYLNFVTNPSSGTINSLSGGGSTNASGFTLQVSRSSYSGTSCSWQAYQ